MAAYGIYLGFVIDGDSRMVLHAAVLPDKTACRVYEELFRPAVAAWGFPDQLNTDQGEEWRLCVFVCFFVWWAAGRATPAGRLPHKIVPSTSNVRAGAFPLCTSTVALRSHIAPAACPCATAPLQQTASPSCFHFHPLQTRSERFNYEPNMRVFTWVRVFLNVLEAAGVLDPSVVLHIRAARVCVSPFLSFPRPVRCCCCCCTLLLTSVLSACARAQALLLPLVHHGVMLLVLAWNQHRVKNIPHRPGSGGVPLKRMTERPHPGVQSTLQDAGFSAPGQEAQAYQLHVGRRLPPVALLSEVEQAQHDHCLVAMQQHVGDVEGAWARLIARDHISLIAGYLAFLMTAAQQN